MHHLVYISKAIVPVNDQVLAKILFKSRAHNESFDITGVLLYGNQYFIQLLEGTQDAVRHLYSQITKDVRHLIVSKLADGPVDQRLFSNWRMGFKALSEEDFKHLAGFMDLGQNKKELNAVEHDEESVLAVLNAFIQSNIHHITAD